MILVSFCWEKNSIHINAHNLSIFSLVFLKLLIVGVAFFLGHPVYFNCKNILQIQFEYASFTSYTAHVSIRLNGTLVETILQLYEEEPIQYFQ